MFPCLWDCGRQLPVDSAICPDCQGGQIVTLAEARVGPCRCPSGAGKMLIATISNGDGIKTNVCQECITPAIARRVAILLVDSKANFPSQHVEAKVTALAVGTSGTLARNYRYQEREVLEAVVRAVAVIHSRRDRGNYYAATTE